MNNPKFSIIDRIKSFKYAFNGLKFFFLNDHNGRVHLLAAIIAIGLSFYLKISSLEWVAILSVISAVFVTEILNSAIEKLADVVSPDYHPKIKVVKDLAAAAVLVAAFLAVAVGLLVFIPKLFL
ncbi:diacylglycerol kinase family protein [Pedobacter alluvionis]|uniref:Diacylglycerol kinase (ATP) n=1 Tax=Pedobacter alluvionis TaxID=475253 RepID=A0A497XY18_9SPHI|nr:diacylglycerol kinase family protein [Pedobacter alluvionis]RLJ75011.1 diacylglycerol kinase (ATP) [Pedobacter alluvionis]TFB30125.1 diacylglycerol kinase family protein [Pedobacter alluvionis]